MRLFMWKHLAEAVAGTSHRRNGQPCQDFCLVKAIDASPESALVLVSADGSGSAARAQQGAQMACEGLMEAVLADLERGQAVSNIDEPQVRRWFQKVRDKIDATAEEHKVPCRDFACTLLLAVVGESAAAFAQLGDGGIVRAEGERYVPVFWPQTGEYANTTNFVTDSTYDQHLQFQVHAARVDELAVFTDGLQAVALEYASREGHAGFFGPMFRHLRNAAVASDLSEGLRDFLGSERINQRTDDDKTLILATRVAPPGSTPPHG
jgi:hypothetical protein